MIACPCSPEVNDQPPLSPQGRGFSKAMTAEEAQAFVGDASCKVTILQDDKLFLEAPSTQPRARSKRQRRDTSSDPLDLTVTTLAFCLNPRHRERGFRH